jgi:hypothetical protein
LSMLGLHLNLFGLQSILSLEHSQLIPVGLINFSEPRDADSLTSILSAE